MMDRFPYLTMIYNISLFSHFYQSMQSNYRFFFLSHFWSIFCFVSPAPALTLWFLLTLLVSLVRRMLQRHNYWNISFYQFLWDAHHVFVSFFSEYITASVIIEAQESFWKRRRGRERKSMNETNMLFIELHSTFSCMEKRKKKNHLVFRECWTHDNFQWNHFHMQMIIEYFSM